MTWWTADDTDDLRDVAEGLFLDSCTLKQPVAASDGSSGYTHTWTTVATVDCGVLSPSQAAQTGLPILETGSDERQMVFSFAHDTTIEQGWQITWDGRDFEVMNLTEFGSIAPELIANGLERG